MLRVVVSFSVLCAAAAAQPASAVTFMSGEKLMQICSIATSDPRYIAAMSRCLGYLQGVADHEVLRSRDVSANKVFCISEPISGDQMMGVVKRYLLSNAGKRRMLASVLVSEAFEQAFPCRKVG